MKISIDPDVDEKLLALIDVLLVEGYFAMAENAIAYVNDIYNFINAIPKQALRPIPNTDPVLDYSQYKPNKQTTWYVVYEIEREDYLIRNVLNNHSADYNSFVARLR